MSECAFDQIQIRYELGLFIPRADGRGRKRAVGFFQRTLLQHMHVLLHDIFGDQHFIERGLKTIVV